jgi:flagellum-specific peptidoglycan hydrolase FlgJ
MTQLSAIDSKANIELITKLAQEFYPTQPIMQDMTIVQAILEGGLWKAPPSTLALKYNNVFGIKGSGTKGIAMLPTTEYIDGKKLTVNAQFASNYDVEDSVQQHTELLAHPRYADVVFATTFEAAAQAIYQAGYATDPNYPTLLINTYNHFIVNQAGNED